MSDASAAHELPPMLLRGDATSTHGTGHVMRLLALGEAWREAGSKAIFLGVLDSQSLQARFTALGIDVQLISEARHTSDPFAPEETLQALARIEHQEQRRPWLAADSYTFKCGGRDTVRVAGFKQLVFDDLCDRDTLIADVVLNQNLGADIAQYSPNSSAVFLLGTTYTLIRRDIRAAATRRGNTVAAGARRIVVTFGGSDPQRLTQRVIAAFNQLQRSDISVTVVVGPANRDAKAIAQAASSVPGLDVRCDPDNLAQLFLAADLAITAAGTTCWELAHIGVPMLIITAAGNQEIVARGLRECGGARVVGDHKVVDETRIAAAIREVIDDRVGREQMSHAGRAMLDGLGGSRVAGVISALEMRHVDASALNFTEVQPHDMWELWRLANEFHVRRNSFDRPTISLEEHQRWFERMLNAPDSVLYVARVAGAFAGQVRFDRVGADTLLINFAVAPPFRGKGVGTRMLTEVPVFACRRLGGTRLRGLVAPSNRESGAAFRKAGFTHAGPTEERGYQMDVYERVVA